jgi:hypothetical protein
MKQGAELIVEERARQVSEEGRTPDHDERHWANELAIAAACYALEDVRCHGSSFQVIRVDRTFVDVASGMSAFLGGDAWPWEEDADKRKKHVRVRRLVIAGALIAAEIDRLQRDGDES